MTAIVKSIEIARPPEDVFAYATDFSHFPDPTSRGTESASCSSPSSAGKRASSYPKMSRS